MNSTNNNTGRMNSGIGTMGSGMGTMNSGMDNRMGTMNNGMGTMNSGMDNRMGTINNGMDNRMGTMNNSMDPMNDGMDYDNMGYENMDSMVTANNQWNPSAPVNPGMSIPSQPGAGTFPACPLPETIPEPLPELPLPTEAMYTPGYLMTRIGSQMQVDFLIGNCTTSRVGKLKSVGASYIILAAMDGSEIVCDLYSIKFVTIMENTANQVQWGVFRD